jgi:hypothetical protein
MVLVVLVCGQVWWCSVGVAPSVALPRAVPAAPAATLPSSVAPPPIPATQSAGGPGSLPHPSPLPPPPSPPAFPGCGAYNQGLGRVEEGRGAPEELKTTQVHGAARLPGGALLGGGDGLCVRALASL